MPPKSKPKAKKSPPPSQGPKSTVPKSASKGQSAKGKPKSKSKTMKTVVRNQSQSRLSVKSKSGSRSRSRESGRSKSRSRSPKIQKVQRDLSPSKSIKLTSPSKKTPQPIVSGTTKGSTGKISPSSTKKSILTKLLSHQSSKKITKSVSPSKKITKTAASGTTDNTANTDKSKKQEPAKVVDNAIDVDQKILNERQTQIITEPEGYGIQNPNNYTIPPLPIPRSQMISSDTDVNKNHINKNLNHSISNRHHPFQNLLSIQSKLREIDDECASAHLLIQAGHELIKRPLQVRRGGLIRAEIPHFWGYLIARMIYMGVEANCTKVDGMQQQFLDIEPGCMGFDESCEIMVDYGYQGQQWQKLQPQKQLQQREKEVLGNKEQQQTSADSNANKFDSVQQQEHWQVEGGLGLDLDDIDTGRGKNSRNQLNMSAVAAGNNSLKRLRSNNETLVINDNDDIDDDTATNHDNKTQQELQNTSNSATYQQQQTQTSDTRDSDANSNQNQSASRGTIYNWVASFFKSPDTTSDNDSETQQTATKDSDTTGDDNKHSNTKNLSDLRKKRNESIPSESATKRRKLDSLSKPYSVSQLLAKKRQSQLPPLLSGDVFCNLSGNGTYLSSQMMQQQLKQRKEIQNCVNDINEFQSDKFNQQHDMKDSTNGTQSNHSQQNDKIHLIAVYDRIWKHHFTLKKVKGQYQKQQKPNQGPNSNEIRSKRSAWLQKLETGAANSSDIVTVTDKIDSSNGTMATVIDNDNSARDDPPGTYWTLDSDCDPDNDSKPKKKNGNFINIDESHPLLSILDSGRFVNGVNSGGSLWKESDTNNKSKQISSSSQAATNTKSNTGPGKQQRSKDTSDKHNLSDHAVTDTSDSLPAKSFPPPILSHHLLRAKYRQALRRSTEILSTLIDVHLNENLDSFGSHQWIFEFRNLLGWKKIIITRLIDASSLGSRSSAVVKIAAAGFQSQQNVTVTDQQIIIQDNDSEESDHDKNGLAADQLQKQTLSMKQQQEQLQRISSAGPRLKLLTTTHTNLLSASSNNSLISSGNSNSNTLNSLTTVTNPINLTPPPTILPSATALTSSSTTQIPSESTLLTPIPGLSSATVITTNSNTSTTTTNLPPPKITLTSQVSSIKPTLLKLLPLYPPCAADRVFLTWLLSDQHDGLEERDLGGSLRYCGWIHGVGIVGDMME